MHRSFPLFPPSPPLHVYVIDVLSFRIQKKSRLYDFELEEVFAEPACRLTEFLKRSELPLLEEEPYCSSKISRVCTKPSFRLIIS